MIDKIINCTNCDLCKNQKPLLDKVTSCDVMWIGLSAKKVEDINKNFPLEADTISGKLIEDIEIKNSNYTFYKTNLVKCLPLDENNKLRYPTNIEMEKCMNNLLIEINALHPKKVFLLGSVVSNYINKYIKKNNIKVDTSFSKIEHPSYICVYKRKFKQDYIDKVSREIQEIIK